MLDGFLSFQFMNKKIRKTLFMSTLILHTQKNIQYRFYKIKLLCQT